MVIGPKILLKLVKEKKLVKNLDKRELTNPEGAGFDLRFNELFEIEGNAFLGVKERQTPTIKKLLGYIKEKNSRSRFFQEPFI